MSSGNKNYESRFPIPQVMKNHNKLNPHSFNIQVKVINKIFKRVSVDFGVAENLSESGHLGFFESILKWIDPLYRGHVKVFENCQ